MKPFPLPIRIPLENNGQDKMVKEKTNEEVTELLSRPRWSRGNVRASRSKVREFKPG